MTSSSSSHASEPLRGSASSNYHSIAATSTAMPPAPERSCSPLTTNDLARRLRAAFTPPRTRRHKAAELASRPRSATASPSVGRTLSDTLMVDGAGDLSAHKKTASCGDLGRLEQIFEPRLAPYTPPLRVRRGIDLSDGFSSSSSSSSLSDEQIEKLETKLFEPRDAACTPPLRRRIFDAPTSSSSAGNKGQRDSDDEEDEDEEVVDGAASAAERREVCAVDRHGLGKVSSHTSPGSMAPSTSDHALNDNVNDLHRVVLQLRTKARESSRAAARQLTDGGQPCKDGAQVTVRQLARLQHKNAITDPQPKVVSCC